LSAQGEFIHAFIEGDVAKYRLNRALAGGYFGAVGISDIAFNGVYYEAKFLLSTR